MLSILAHDRVTRLPFSMGSVVTILDGTECLQSDSIYVFVSNLTYKLNIACTQTISRFCGIPHYSPTSDKVLAFSPSLDNLDMVGFEVGIFRL